MTKSPTDFKIEWLTDLEQIILSNPDFCRHQRFLRLCHKCVIYQECHQNFPINGNWYGVQKGYFGSEHTTLLDLIRNARAELLTEKLLKGEL